MKWSDIEDLKKGDLVLLKVSGDKVFEYEIVGLGEHAVKYIRRTYDNDHRAMWVLKDRDMPAEFVEKISAAQDTIKINFEESFK